MEPREYAATRALEDHYWWFRSARAFIDDLLAGEALGGVHVLDVGCGAGKNAAWLSERGARVVALDASRQGLSLARGRGLRALLRADANRLPLASGAFDLVLSVDLLECSAVDQRCAVNEMARVVRPGGRVLLWAAAFSWLASEHDRAVHSTQRVTLAGLKALAHGAGLEVERATYFYRLLFPALAGRKLLSRLRPAAARPRSDLRPLPPAIDALLYRLCQWERRRLGPRAPRLPGTTAAVLARRPA